MTRRLAILASETSWYYRQLSRAAVARGMHVSRIGFPSLASHLSPGNLKNPDIENEIGWTPEFDIAIVRTMPVGSLEQVIFRMDVLRNWINRGIKVVNSPQCLETSIDKLLTLESFRVHQVPFPETFACQTAEQGMEAFEACQREVVVKPIFGGEGRGIMRICEPELAYRVFKSLEATRSVIYCQRFVKDLTRDIRILFVGDQAFAVLRSNANSWMSNASQGGTGTAYEPSAEELELGWRAAKSVEGTIVGVDLIRDAEGQLMVLEVNAVPGWQMLQRVTGHDIAEEIIRFLSQQ